jgi:hypothetical protein
MRRAQSSRMVRGRSQEDDLRGLLGALEEPVENLHYTLTALARSIEHALTEGASAEERDALAARVRSLRVQSSTALSAILGQTHTPHDGRQLRMNVA